MNIRDVKVGDKLLTDSGFTCLRGGQVLPVLKDDGGHFITCDEGKHYLDGQADGDGNLIGLTKVAEEVCQ